MEGGSLLVSGITKRFGGLVAVKEMSFAVQAGEILGLIGPNGSGKSTILRVMAGTYVPSDFEYTFIPNPKGPAGNVMGAATWVNMVVLPKGGKETDLAFELLYRSSWFDRALPITQIARSRPGIFGWPPLYALLVYAMLVVLGLFLRRLAQALAPEGFV